MKYLNALPITVALAALGACDPFMEEFKSEPVDDQCGADTGSVTGEWVITGTGQRDDCDDGMFDTSFFTLGPSTLRIEQTASNDLQLGEIIDNFTFDGEVDRQCITFTTAEMDAAGTLVYEWSGLIVGSDIEGNFTGSGPPGCEVQGDFEVEIK